MREGEGRREGGKEGGREGKEEGREGKEGGKEGGREGKEVLTKFFTTADIIEMIFKCVKQAPLGLPMCHKG